MRSKPSPYRRLRHTVMFILFFRLAVGRVTTDRVQIADVWYKGKVRYCEIWDDFIAETVCKLKAHLGGLALGRSLNKFHHFSLISSVYSHIDIPIGGGVIPARIMADLTIQKSGSKRPRENDKQKLDPSTKKRKNYDEKPVRANRREERRQIMAQAKTTWEKLRPKARSKEESVSLVKDLLKILSGRIVEFVFRHDGSRIVQWMLTDGNERQKENILAELMEGSKRPAMEGERPFFVQLACDRYGHHLAFKVLRVADKKHKNTFFEQNLKGNVSQLIRSAHGADVLDFAFQTVLRAREKSEVVLELLYSKEKKLLDIVRAKLKNEKQHEKVSNKSPVQSQPIFEQSLQLLGTEFKDVAVESAATVLNQLIDKENFLRFELIHAAAKEYLHVVMTSYPKEKSQELAVLLAPVLVHFAHTKPGINVAVNCVKILDAKHRKKAIRGLKTHIRKLLENEYGHRLILALFEWVDDTRLVGKTVSTEIFSDSSMAAEMAEINDAPAKSSSRGGKKKAEKKGLDTAEKKKKNSSKQNDLDYLSSLCQHKYARIPLLSLFFGRNTRYFNPDVYSLVWCSVDTEKFGQLSKKDPDARRSELRVFFDSSIGEVMRRDMSILLQSRWSAPVVLGALAKVETRSAVVEGVKSALGSDESIQQLLQDTCARKTLATMFKVGGTDFAATVLDGCGVDFISRLASSENTLPIAQNLVAACGRSDAEKALRRAEKMARSVR